MHKLTFILLVVGGLNWLLVGLFQWDLVVAVLGSWPMVVRVVYVLVGVAAVYELFTHKRSCKGCEAPSQM